MPAFRDVDAEGLWIASEEQGDASPVPAAQAYSVPFTWIKESQGLRFDAEHYNPTIARAMAVLHGSGMDLRPLGEVTERVFIPPRFKRVYVEEEYGLPFLQGSHLVHSDPADIKYVSKKAHKHLDQWVIRHGWVLVTRSGTIGRATLARRTWDEWAASEHILRIVPDPEGDVPPGYLLAFLRSFPGQAQLTSHIYGAVVDELTEAQTRAVLVPVAKNSEQREAVAHINRTVLEGIARQEEAVSLQDDALRAVNAFLAT